MPDSDEAVRDFTTAIHGMAGQVKSAWRQAFGQKIGLSQATAEDEALITSLLSTMSENQADFTNTFRALATDSAPRDQFTDPAAFDSWEPVWRARIAAETDPYGLMQSVNPARIPRNHRVEQMIQAAEEGDMAPFQRLMASLAHPFTDDATFADLTHPPKPGEEVKQTFCGT